MGDRGVRGLELGFGRGRGILVILFWDDCGAGEGVRLG